MAVGPHSGAATDAVALGDFHTVTAYSFRTRLLRRSSSGVTSFRAVVGFWKGNPLSSIRPATALVSNSTYTLVWSAQGAVWTISLTSSPPGHDLRVLPGNLRVVLGCGIARQGPSLRNVTHAPP